MADTVLTELKIHVFDTAGQLSQHESEIGDNDLAFTLDDEVDYVVESQLPTADNGYTWYRKYKSGWVEQGGKIAKQTSTNITITFIIPMADTNYNWTLSCGYNNDTAAVRFNQISCWGLTTTTMGVRADTNYDKLWVVRGMSEQ